MSWDWQVFCEDTLDRAAVAGCFGKGGDVTYLDWLLSAWGWTISVSLLSLAIALVLGALIGTLRTLEQRPIIKALCSAWVELFRNIPLLVQLFLWYHVVPTLFPAMRLCVGGAGAGVFYLVAYCRAGAIGHRNLAAWPALRRHGDGL